MVVKTKTIRFLIQVLPDTPVAGGHTARILQFSGSAQQNVRWKGFALFNFDSILQGQE